MQKRKNIDRTLKERRGIVTQLERLTGSGITVDEMNEVGTLLQKAGRRALPPLVRRLWREKNGDVIARYTYLLDFFEDESWLEQLIQITLRRRDLEAEGRLALLAALASCGVDTDAPPFSLLMEGDDLSVTLTGMLDRGEKGLAGFVEDFLFSDGEDRLELIRRMASIDDERVVPLLETLLAVDDHACQVEICSALGRVRRAAAARLLRRMTGHGDAEVRRTAEKSLRRLSFLGIDAIEAAACNPAPFHAAWASSLDGAGFGTVWISRWGADGGIDALYLQIHDEQGINAAWGCRGLSVREYETHLTQIQGEDGIIAVPVEFALEQVRNGIHRNREQGTFMPAEFYLLHDLFDGEGIEARRYEPRFPGYDLNALATSARHVAAGTELFEDDLFTGWYLATGRVYDFAEEWSKLDAAGERRGVEALVARFVQELCVPDAEAISRRLFCNADLMVRIGRERELVERTLAAAASISRSPLPLQHHPFLKRLALESMDMAREALAEGYDLRLHPLDSDDEWE